MTAEPDVGISGRGSGVSAQAAMEYLMTYGWAIVILAVVLGALAYLGVFNPIDYAPKAQPGACSVYRPFGPNTTTDINTVGVCNNEIPIQTVSFSQSSSCAANGYVPIRINQLSITSTPQLTITWWSDYSSDGVNVHMDSSNVAPGGDGIYCSSTGCEIPYNSVSAPQSVVLSANKWYFYALVLSSSGTATFYINSQQGSPVSWNSNIGFTGISDFDILGYEPYCSDWTKGSMANVQLYTTSLDQNSITALYQEGIGGVPIDLQNLVGWWPLNGNANDYSGNGNNGTPVNVIFTTNWYNGYSQP